MARNIILCGATSAGKRKAVNWLSNNLKGFNPITNVARNRMAKDSITREDILQWLERKDTEKFLQLQRRIIEDQNNLESEGGPFISINALAFAFVYAGPEAVGHLEQESATQSCLKRYREPECSVVVLRPMEEPTDDGTHLMQSRKEQKEFTQALCDLLDKY